MKTVFFNLISSLSLESSQNQCHTNSNCVKSVYGISVFYADMKRSPESKKNVFRVKAPLPWT